MNWDQEYQTLYSALETNSSAKSWATRRGENDEARRLLDVERAAITQSCINHCRAAIAHYSALAAPYRLAMWKRRLRLHESGRAGEVWDGTDPVESERTAGNDQAFGGHRFTVSA